MKCWLPNLTFCYLYTLYQCFNISHFFFFGLAFRVHLAITGPWLLQSCCPSKFISFRQPSKGHILLEPYPFGWTPNTWRNPGILRKSMSHPGCWGGSGIPYKWFPVQQNTEVTGPPQVALVGADGGWQCRWRLLSHCGNWTGGQGATDVGTERNGMEGKGFFRMLGGASYFP